MSIVKEFTNTMKPELFINHDDFQAWLARALSRSEIVAPVEAWGRRQLKMISIEDLDQVRLDGFRTVESFKSFLFLLTEKVAEPWGKERLFLGARGCDLEALEALDRIFGEGEFKDPFYLANREKITVIGADCTDCGATCFCRTVGGQPYPTKLFDLSLTPVEGGYIVVIGTAKGEKLVKADKELFSETVARAKAEAKRKIRQKTIGRLAEVNRDYQFKLNLAESHKINLENKVWRSLTKDCVECSACNFICPTCTCFLLVDAKQTTDNLQLTTNNQRYKVWDACLKNGYARVAGGGNSRPQLYQRLQNRYHCKFDYSYDRLGRYTCVGCGRCIDGCAGNIEMRRIFKELERQAPLTAKLV